MNDNADAGDPEEENLSELRFSRTQSYFDKSLTIKILIGIIFALCLFLFLHFRETFVESLELGAKAKKFVVAQVAFEYPDDEATIILKQEAGRELGTVFRINDDEIHARTTEFQKYITQDDIGSMRWGQIAQESDFENLALALSLFSDGLTQSRFTDARTLQKIDELPQKELPLSPSSFFVFIPPRDGDSSRLPPQFWGSFGKLTFVHTDIPPVITTFILRYFQNMDWEFVPDQGLEYTLRKLAQGRIPPKYTLVYPGERIIDQGETISARHLAMLAAMKDALRSQRKLLDPMTIGGSVLMTLLFVFVTIIYLRENHRDIFRSNRKLALVASVLLLTLLVAKVSEVFFMGSSSDYIDISRFPLYVPFAAILLASLMNVRIAGFATLFLSVIFALALAVAPVDFLVINVLTGMVAIICTRAIRRRKEVFVVCAKTWLASLLIVFAFNLYDSTAFTFPILTDITSTFIFMALTAIVVVGLLPMLESIFQIITDITLMEFMDPSNELLRRLTIEAPGTYQHSMVVGNLAETAASAIGANGLFCRVATQYHDIGKLANPQYFTENQLGGVDMHQLLTPLESAQVIIAHVSEGVAMARKVGLPEQFIDVIKEHHGTTLVYYFYHKQIELGGGDKSTVSEGDFRYSGPKPRSKESTIIMIADTLEAASRSLDEFDEKSIHNLVDTLIAQKMEDGQFDDSLLTFEELSVVKRTLEKSLLAATHPRIKYPPHHPGEEG